VGKREQRVVVLGLDGATFEVLLPMMERGELPNLSRVMREGVWGRLESTIPPFSVQAWVSMATGKNPAKHGIIDFWTSRPDEARRQFVNAFLVRGETLWDIFGRHGKRVGVANVPVTYPPREVRGYLISGLLTPSREANYTYPPQLREEVISAVGEYDPDPFDLRFPPRKEFLEEIIYWVRKHEQANRYLLQSHPWDFFMNVVQALDSIHHVFWNLLDESHPYHDARAAREYGGLIEAAYEAIDDVVGQRLGLVDEGATLFIVSDHGFGPAYKRFHVNRFLVERGLLVFKKEGVSPLGRLFPKVGLSQEVLKGWVRRADVLGLRHRVRRWARKGLWEELDRKLSRPIDWNRTKAYAGSTTSHGIYINLRSRSARGIVEPGDYERWRELIIEELQGLKDPESDEPIVREVYRKDEIYRGRFLPLLPDIVFSLENRPYLADDNTSAKRMLEDLGYGGGKHEPDGVFMAVGANIEGPKRVSGARIIDVPREMDGIVLGGIFSPQYRGAMEITYEEPEELKNAEGEMVYDEEEMQRLEERLKGLGYLG
jgi:predicted AlkP superfamily phosphohydrolase/phosphomutase